MANFKSTMTGQQVEDALKKTIELPGKVELLCLKIKEGEKSLETIKSHVQGIAAVAGMEIDITPSELEIKEGWIDNSTSLWVKRTVNFSHSVIEVPTGCNVTITRNDTASASYCFLKSYEFAPGRNPDFATGYSNVVYIRTSGGKKVTVKVPEDAKYLYIGRRQETDRTPESIVLTITGTIDEELRELSSGLESLNEELESRLGEEERVTEIVNITKTNTKEWANTNIPCVYGIGDKFKIELTTDGNADISVRTRVNGATSILFRVNAESGAKVTTIDYVSKGGGEYFLIVPEKVLDSSTWSIKISKYINSTGLTGELNELKNRVEYIEGTYSEEKPKYESILGKKGLVVNAETLTDGERITLTEFPQYNRFGNEVAFTAKFSSFSELRFYNGKGSYGYKYLTLTGSYIAISDDSGEKQRWEHGLTLRDYVNICFSSLDNGKLRVQMNTVGAIMKDGNDDYHDFDVWSYASGQLSFLSVGTTFTEVKISATNRKYRCPFWIFGASQEGPYSNRWLGQLMKMGNTNFLANSLSGRNSVDILDDLKRALKYGCPNYVFFSLSNDNYDYSTYKSRMDAAKAVADEYGFEIIFVCKAVTPSTSATAEQQLRKRNTVINYGCRYFDYGKAVSANPEDPTKMYANHLGPADNWVHPVSELGAKAIAMRFIIDVPEIMQYKG